MERAYPETILFDADGTPHEAIVGEPIAAPTDRSLFVRHVDGVPYQIFIRLGGGFIARPIEAS